MLVLAAGVVEPVVLVLAAGVVEPVVLVLAAGVVELVVLLLAAGVVEPFEPVVVRAGLGGTAAAFFLVGTLRKTVIGDPRGANLSAAGICETIGAFGLGGGCGQTVPSFSDAALSDWSASSRVRPTSFGTVTLALSFGAW